MASESEVRVSRGQFHAIWRQLTIVAGSLALTYCIAFLTLMIRWMNFWIRGSYFISYQVIFLVILAALIVLWLTRYHNGPPPLLSTVIFSMCAGYVAGLFALILYPIFQENGFRQIMTSLQFPAPEAAVALLWFPVKLLSWLFGAMTGLISVVISRWLRRMRLSRR
ncbi:MAG TPA: hypothetical protein VIU63_10555 [Nitrospira sp.]